MPHTHHVRVRYGEVDAQGVVFNAHWLAYADDAVTRWFEHLGYDLAELWRPGARPTFDVMVRSASLDFAGSAGFDDEVALEVAPVRLGTSSFDLRIAGTVADRHATTVVLTYVVVAPGEARSMPIPDDLRARLDADMAAAGAAP